MAEKVLWVVGYSKLADFAKRAVDCGVTHVAIRSDNDVLAAIKKFHPLGIRVFGWRWPSSERTNAMKEATRAAALFGEGMDGYVVDPEGEPGKPWDWDRQGLENLAADFSSTVVAAAAGRPFGVTSHFRGKNQHPKLPWEQFFKRASVLLPQAYWRVEDGNVAHGKPAENYQTAIDAWIATGGKRELIVPMAGELASVSGAEIDQYVAKAASLNIDRLHFYTYGTNVPTDVWAAVSRA